MTKCTCESCSSHLFVPEFFKKTPEGLYCNNCNHLVTKYDYHSGFYEFELPLTVNLNKLYNTLDQTNTYKLIDRMIKDTEYRNLLFNSKGQMSKYRPYTVHIEEAFLMDVITGTIEPKVLVELALSELDGDGWDLFLEWIQKLYAKFLFELTSQFPKEYQNLNEIALRSQEYYSAHKKIPKEKEQNPEWEKLNNLANKVKNGE